MRVNTTGFGLIFAVVLLMFTGVSVAADWAKGEIRKIDIENKRLTIKHGEIPNLDMPPMTMVFRVKDANLLTPYAAGDLIQFQAEMDGKNYVLTAIRKE
ncbi:MAG: copper-binding protein [Polynucleobacter sp.]|nr:copper-binding protein [Polynucleobacter sp.]MDZ4058042.1 copper-binding protein [Polynucleobacter sp.]